MDKEKVGKFYDVVWTEYLPEYEASENHWKIFYSDTEVAGKKVLDAGCGTGIFSIIFAKNGAGSVTGIDISEGSLGTAKSLKDKFNLETVFFQKEDMLKLPFADESFDIVWAWGTVHHTTDPFGAIEELIRVLKKEGSILLAVYTKTKSLFFMRPYGGLCSGHPSDRGNSSPKSWPYFLLLWFSFSKNEKNHGRGKNWKSSLWIGILFRSGFTTTRQRSRTSLKKRDSP